MTALMMMALLASGPGSSNRMTVANVFRQQPAPAAAGAPVKKGAAPVVVENVGPAHGSEVSVVVDLGGLSVETKGRIVPCLRDKVCAQLPNGKRVTGAMQGGKFVMEPNQ